VLDGLETKCGATKGINFAHLKEKMRDAINQQKKKSDELRLLGREIAGQLRNDN